MVEKRFAEAFSEVLWYLKGINKQDYNKIPTKFIQYLNENSDKTYKNEFDYTKPLKELKLRQETIALIDMLYLNYWCDTEDEKKDFLDILRTNSNKHQENLKTIYSLDVFENTSKKETKNELELVECKESIMEKIIEKIKLIIQICFKK